MENQDPRRNSQPKNNTKNERHYQMSKKLGQPSQKDACLYACLRVPPANRDEQNIQTIIDNTKVYDFFKKYQSKHVECAKHFHLIEVAAGQAIVEYQSEPDQFFFLLSGEAVIFLRKTPQQLENDKGILKKIGTQQWRIMQDPEHRLLSHWHFQGEICKFKKISDVKEGASFGELGIIYNKPRIALIVSRTKCRLAILKKLEYLKIFCETENFERKQKREFIFGHFFAKFRELKYQTCQAILYSFREKVYTINEYICRQGEPFTGLFLIKSGQVVLSQQKDKKVKLISIVSRGYHLCYDEWKTTMENSVVATLGYSAKVSSSEARVYSLELSEMQRLYNFKALLKEMDSNVSYAQYLTSHHTAMKTQSDSRLRTEENAKDTAEVVVGGLKQQIVKERCLIKEMKQAMLASLLCCDVKPKEQPKKFKLSRKSSLKRQSNSMLTVSNFKRSSQLFVEGVLQQSLF